MPLTVFSVKGLSGHRRERIEAWIAVDPRGMVRLLMTGPGGFERSVSFAPDEDAAVISEMVGASLED
jgi:hypothetical protein